MLNEELPLSPIAAYLKGKEIIERTTFKIVGSGETFYIVEGIDIPEKEFLKANPIPYLHAGKAYKDNCNSHHNH